MPKNMPNPRHFVFHPRQPGFTLRASSAIVPTMSSIPKSAPTVTETGSEQDYLISLLTKVQAKNRDAFEALYDLTVKQIYSHALRITRQHELAEEVVGDVYLQVWRHGLTYNKTRGAVRAWLSVICRSRALDALRHMSAITPAGSTVTLDEIPDVEDTQQPLDLLNTTEEHSALHVALGKLDTPQRQLLTLAYFRGYTHSELAAFTGIPLGTVKSNLHRTVSLLKKFMSEDDAAGGPNE